MWPYYLTSVLQLVGARRVYVEKAAWVYHFWPTSTGLWQIPAGKAVWCSALGEGGWRELYSATVSPSEVNQSLPEAPNTETRLVNVPHTHPYSYSLWYVSFFTTGRGLHTLKCGHFWVLLPLFPLFFLWNSPMWKSLGSVLSWKSYRKLRMAWKSIPDRKLSFHNRYAQLCTKGSWEEVKIWAGYL